mmetsp:Transcript_30264/g.62459  ORF Transcript_30264/g.62459 Transcript_30264/m.62459 type:complete len:163 (+) Transcript_30264:637-1125(+)
MDWSFVNSIPMSSSTPSSLPVPTPTPTSTPYLTAYCVCSHLIPAIATAIFDSLNFYLFKKLHLSKAAATSSNPPPTKPSENNISNDKAAHQSLLEEHRDRVQFQLDKRQRQQQHDTEAKKKSRESELSNPTRGSYFTMVRKLDGFPARKKRTPALVHPTDRC